MTTDELAALVENRLGVTLKKKDQFSVSDLNDFPEELIWNARLLKDIGSILPYLEFYVNETDRSYIKPFMHQVILGHKDMKTWRKGRVLVPDVTLEDQLTKGLPEIYGAFLPELKAVRKPELRQWSQKSTIIGAFAIPQPEAGYRSPVPPGFLPVDQAELLLTDEAHPEIPFRRWIACRAAMDIQPMDQFNDAQAIYALQEFAKKSMWTTDAQKAIAGLLEERKQDLWKDGTIPGFCGPDAFYI